MLDTQAETESRRTRHKERTRRRLIEAGEHLFRTRGFDGTTIEDIAGGADVAKGTFFNYFESKEWLLGEILHERFRALLSAPPAPGACAWERIQLLLEAMWDELAPYRAISRRILALALARPVPESADPDRTTPSAVLAGLIREGQSVGDFRPDIRSEVAAVLLVTFFLRASVLECGSDKDTPETCRAYLREGLKILHGGLATVSS